MVLASPANAVRGGSHAFSLPAQHILTPDNLRQMRVHGVEYVVVIEPDTRSDEVVAQDVAQAARHLLQIFGGADLSDNCMARFFEQVWAYRTGRN